MIDTFRSTAVERIKFWVHRAGVLAMKADHGSDLAGLAYNAFARAPAIGVGEQIDDLSPFDPQEFAKALTGAEA